MKYVDEYRDARAVEKYVAAIRRDTSRPWQIMEICGGQTHAILKHGLDRLLPDEITLLHGPGCPVCVTPAEIVDCAVEIALRDDAVLCSFGDMLRVPGSGKDLLTAKAEGGNVRMVYSPIDAVKFAQACPEKQVVFFAIGFETTAPANATAVKMARELELTNFSLLVSQLLVPPAISVILSSADCQVNAFLAAGHVCTVMGYRQYERIADQHQVPIVVTGFEPLDILQGIHMVIKQLEAGQVKVENQYSRAVRHSGNQVAQDLMKEYFTVADCNWRGFGVIPKSGLVLREKYEFFDARLRWKLSAVEKTNGEECISRLILQGRRKPNECPVFGSDCTPEHPLGALMVSSEGACSAYYRYRKPS